MKIAWFHGNLLHTHSGGTRFVVDYTGGLRRVFGHEVTVFCDCASEEVRDQLEDVGVSLVEMDRFSTNHPVYWLTLPCRILRKRRALRDLMRGFDCIVTSLFPMNVLVEPFSVPTVQMCYEPFAFFYDKGFMQNYTWAERFFFRVMAMLYSRYDKRAVRNMDRVLTVNKTNLPKIQTVYGVEATPVYAGIDASVYKRAADESIRALRRKHVGEPLLFHSTDLTGIKGTYPLLDVIKRLVDDFPKLKLLVTIYVDVPDGIRRFKKHLVDMGLEDHVEYLGCLPKEALPLYYSSVDFVCQPSINQPANWPLKEAQLCGTPIIGGVECEEVNGRNGVKVDVTNTDESVALLKVLFGTARNQFEIDLEGLIEEYSIGACLSKFNEIVETA